MCSNIERPKCETSQFSFFFSSFLQALEVANKELAQRLAETEAASEKREAELEANITDLTASLYEKHRE